MVDIANALTGSVDRGGTGGMLADLNMNGYRVTGAGPGVEQTDLATVSQIIGSPVGAVIDFAGDTPPSGWLLCGGQSLSRADYADLFDVIGTTYGSVDANSFNLPDCRGRVTAGVDFTTAGMANRLTDDTMSPSGADLGAVGGVEGVILTKEQLAAHTHTISGTTNSAGSHSHDIPGTSGGGGTNIRTVTDHGSPGNGGHTNVAGDHTHTLSGTASSAGGDQAHPNVQPTILFSKIIYTGVA